MVRRHKNEVAKRPPLEAEILERVRDELEREIASPDGKPDDSDAKTYAEKYSRKPWARIELDFITAETDAFASEIARKWEIDSNFLRRYARRHRWLAKRAKYRDDVRDAVLKECSRRTARLAIEKLEKLVESWGGTVDSINEKLAADAKASSDLPPVFETVTVSRGKDSKGNATRTIVRRRSAAYGSATQRALLNRYPELLIRLGGLLDRGPRDAGGGSAGARPIEATVVSSRPGSPADFAVAFRAAVGSMLGPGAFGSPVPPKASPPPPAAKS